MILFFASTALLLSSTKTLASPHIYFCQIFALVIRRRYTRFVAAVPLSFSFEFSALPRCIIHCYDRLQATVFIYIFTRCADTLIRLWHQRRLPAQDYTFAHSLHEFPAYFIFSQYLQCCRARYMARRREYLHRPAFFLFRRARFSTAAHGFTFGRFITGRYHHLPKTRIQHFSRVATAIWVTRDAARVFSRKCRRLSSFSCVPVPLLVTLAYYKRFYTYNTSACLELCSLADAFSTNSLEGI